MNDNNMIAMEDAIKRIDQHWAVTSIDKDDMARAMEIAKTANEITEDTELVRQAASAYEIAALERVGAIVHPWDNSAGYELKVQAQAAALRAYSLLRTLPVPTELHAKIFHVLRLMATGCISGQLVSLRHWFKEHDQDVLLADVPTTDWPLWMRSRLYECWVALIRDADGCGPMIVQSLLAHIRDQRRKCEYAALDGLDSAEHHAATIRLLSLYHWMKATELIAIFCFTRKRTPELEAKCDKHFEFAQILAWNVHDVDLDVALRWLHAASKVIISDMPQGASSDVEPCHAQLNDWRHCSFVLDVS